MSTERAFKSNRNIVYSCKYHIVFCPKYRRKVLVNGIDERMKRLTRALAVELRVDILALEVMPDHVHLLCEVDPQLGIHKFVKALKGRTSRLLRQEYPELKRRLPTLWTHAYFVATVGGAPLSAIKQYIENQKKYLMQLRVYKYRLYPTPSQEKALVKTLRICRYWYNMCLAERKLAWELEQRTVSKGEQEKTSSLYRKTFRCADAVFSQTLQSVCDDLDKAFQAYFRRVKAGETPGYPRYKSANRFNSFTFKQFGAGARLDGKRLKLYGIGRVRVRWHRALVGQVKQVRILHRAGRWCACFTVEQADPLPLPPTGQVVGIDVGIAALLTTSDGEQVPNPGWYRAAQAELRVAQRSLQRKTKGGQNRKKALRRVQRVHEHIADIRRDFLNKQVYRLVHRYDGIAIEDLRIANMVRNPHLAKSILDSGWGYFKEQLACKAVNAGRQVVFVNPAYTSKTCSACGAEFPHFSLATRWVDCVCGLSLDRDHNAALNILHRAGWVTSVSANVDAPGHALLRSPRL